MFSGGALKVSFLLTPQIYCVLNSCLLLFVAKKYLKKKGIIYYNNTELIFSLHFYFSPGAWHQQQLESQILAEGSHLSERMERLKMICDEDESHLRGGAAGQSMANFMIGD